MNLQSETKRLRFWLLWTISTAVGWLLVVYAGLRIRDAIITSWNMLLPLAWTLLVNSIVLGLIVGLLQYFVWRFHFSTSGWWIVYSTAGYAIGSSVGFLVASAGIGLFHPEVLSGNGSDFLAMPLASSMLLGGLIIGGLQVPVLPKANMTHRGRIILLWILGTSLAWGLGFFVTGYTWAWGMPLYVQSASAGAMIGAFTAAVLLMISMKSNIDAK